MDHDFLAFINSVELEDIPWERLVSTNGRASEIPDQIRRLGSLDPQKASLALRSLSLEIEHQETLWTVAPFALIFMGRCGDQLRSSEHQLTKLQANLSEYFQELLTICSESLRYFNREETKVFASWDEFFKKEHLLPPVNYEALEENDDDKEEYEEELDWEEDLPDSQELVLSCYEYSRRLLEHYLNKWQEPLSIEL